MPWRSLAGTQIRKAWPFFACHLSSSGKVLPWLKSPCGLLLTVCSEHKQNQQLLCFHKQNGSTKSYRVRETTTYFGTLFTQTQSQFNYLPRQSVSDMEILPKILKDWLKSQWEKQTSQNPLQKLINRFSTNIEARIIEL